MNNQEISAEEIIKGLRKIGLSNGVSLGFHSGLCDIAADLIAQLQAKIEELEIELQEERCKCHHCTQDAYRYNG